MAKSMTSAPAATIDAYIAGFPAPVQKVLKQIRATVRAAAPATEEAIKYAMPAFLLDGKQLVLFAAFKKHIGFSRHLRVSLLLRKRWPVIKQGRVRYNFRWTRRCRWR